MEWACSIVGCRKSKVYRHNTCPLDCFTAPDSHFDHVHRDLVGSLPVQMATFTSQRVLTVSHDD